MLIFLYGDNMVDNIHTKFFPFKFHVELSSAPISLLSQCVARLSAVEWTWTNCWKLAHATRKTQFSSLSHIILISYHTLTFKHAHTTYTEFLFYAIIKIYGFMERGIGGLPTQNVCCRSYICKIRIQISSINSKSPIQLRLSRSSSRGLSAAVKS